MNSKEKCIAEAYEEYYFPVIGYEGIYEVNESGQLKSIERVSIQKNNKKYSVKEKIMKPQIDNTGYIVFGLRKNKETKKCYLHRILAECFIPNPENKPCINHINGVKHDNSISNLEWVTYSENNNHAFNIGLQKKGKEHHLYGKKGIDCHNHKLYNRGWIKIESEADLPKEAFNFYDVCRIEPNGDFISDKKVNYTDLRIHYFKGNVTHYKLTEVLLHPLF